MATVILCYHSVDDSDSLVSVRPAAFARQMAYLARLGYVVVGLDEALGTAQRGTQVAITFDDGYRSVLTEALPILRQHGFPATVFFATGFAGRRADWIRRDFPLLFEGGGPDGPQGCRAAVSARMPYYARLGEHALVEAVAALQRIGGLPILDWDEARTLRDAGIGFGSHTVTHPYLTGCDDAALATELEQSRQAIERELDRPVTSFCYPYSDLDPRVRDAVAVAGYRWAVTTHPGVVGDPAAEPLSLLRVSVRSGRRLPAFAASLTPAYAWYAARRWGREALGGMP